MDTPATLGYIGSIHATATATARQRFGTSMTLRHSEVLELRNSGNKERYPLAHEKDEADTHPHPGHAA